MNRLGRSGVGEGERGPKGPRGISVSGAELEDNEDGTFYLSFSLTDGTSLGPYLLSFQNSDLIIHGLVISSLAANKVVGTNNDKELTTLSYTDNATASTLVYRDASGDAAFHALTTTVFTSKNITDDETNVTIGTGESLAHLVPAVDAVDDGDNDTGQDLGQGNLVWRNIYVLNTLNASDANYKKDIITDESDYYSLLDELRVVRFNWKSNSTADPENPSEIGLIAQEVEEIFPEVVKTETLRGAQDKKFINYLKLIPILIHMMQSMKSRISDLEAQLSIITEE